MGHGSSSDAKAAYTCEQVPRASASRTTTADESSEPRHIVFGEVGVHVEAWVGDVVVDRGAAGLRGTRGWMSIGASASHTSHTQLKHDSQHHQRKNQSTHRSSAMASIKLMGLVVVQEHILRHATRRCEELGRCRTTTTRAKPPSTTNAPAPGMAGTQAVQLRLECG